MALQFNRLWLFCAICLWCVRATFGFSLLGPFAPWMTPDVGFIHDEGYDIGGPRNLGDEFRWNVPVLTYGFDDDFKNFFGQPGIDAVEKAVAMLNALPPASQMDLVSAPIATLRINLAAQAATVNDLKSFALLYLLEQMGLANPTRFVWVATSTNLPIRGSESDGPYESIIQRNFDPFAFSPTNYINSARYTYTIEQFDSTLFSMLLPDVNRIAESIALDSLHPTASVASHLPDMNQPSVGSGEYFTALTRDDLAGLKYLLDTNNVNVEPCMSSVRAFGRGDAFVKTAPRPGVDKITFQRFDPGSAPIANVFVDRYFSDSGLQSQTLQRVIQTPDILFTAANHPRQFDTPPPVRRTRPNFSHQNEMGSGIFGPEVVISFEKYGDINREPWYTDLTTGEVFDPRWSSFDSRTVTLSPIFPVGPAYQGGRTLSVRAIDGTNSAPTVEWRLRLIAGVQYAIEKSSDLKSWTSSTNITALPIHTLTNSAAADSTTMFWRARRISGQ